jgi:hypothetical protein
MFKHSRLFDPLQLKIALKREIRDDFEQDYLNSLFAFLICFLSEKNVLLSGLTLQTLVRHCFSVVSKKVSKKKKN